MNIKSLYFIGIISMSLFLSACGFHLRGMVNLPPQLKKIYLHSFSPYNNLTKQTRSMLQFSGIQVVDSPKQASSTLDLLSENLTTTQTSIGGSDQLQSYLITYTVSFSIKDSKGNELVGPKTVQSQKTVHTLQNEIISNSNKLDQTQQTLYRDVIIKILDNLTANSTLRALNRPR